MGLDRGNHGSGSGDKIADVINPVTEPAGRMRDAVDRRNYLQQMLERNLNEKFENSAVGISAVDW
jgi:hypothetical protein